MTAAPVDGPAPAIAAAPEVPPPAAVVEAAPPETTAERRRMTTRRKTSGAHEPATETHPAPHHIDIDVGSLVRRQWKHVLAATVAITLISLFAAAMQPKRFRASSIGAVTPIGENLSNSDVLRGVDSLDRRVVVASLAALASAPVTLRDAKASDGETIVASVLPNTNLFRIEVEASDAARATQIANRVPAVLNAQAKKMYRMYGVTLISEAAAPRSPSTPRIGRAVATGLVLGLIAGIASAWLLDRRRAAP